MGAGLVAGLILGLAFGKDAAVLAPLGTAFLDLLKMLVLPLTFCTIVSGVAGIAQGQRLGRVAWLTALLFLASTLMASAIGIACTDWLQPGVGYPVDEAALAARASERPPLALADLLRTAIHPNLVQAAAELQLLPVMLFGLALGASLRGLGQAGRPAVAAFAALNLALMQMVLWALRLAPFGIAALIATQIARVGGMEGLAGLLGALALWVSSVLLGLGIQGLLLYASLVLFVPAQATRLPRAMSSALLTAFSTASSNATLPAALAGVEAAGIAPAVARLVVPLGAVLNMNGTALYEAMAALFIAQAYGIPLGLYDQILIVLLASIAATGAAGIPEAGLVTMVLVLTAVGLPVEGIGLLLAVDWLLDRFRTMVNVWGDCTTAALVERFSGRTSAADSAQQ